MLLLFFILFIALSLSNRDHSDACFWLFLLMVLCIFAG